MAPTAKKPVKKEKPWWLKQRRFVIPSTLNSKIRDLPEEIQKFYCYIVSKVIVTSKKHSAMYHPISSEYFKDFIGSEYRGYVNQLRKWRIIEVNDQYLNDPEEGFCKSYRLSLLARRARKVKVCFRKKQVQPLRDNSELPDEVAEFVYNNLKRIGVKTELAPQANAVDEVEAEDWAEKVFFGQLNVHYSSKTKRLYHTAINMPRVARKNLILKDEPAVPLFEYDVKSCTPVILLTLAKDPVENAKLKAFLDDDIYKTIANEGGVTKGRDDIKRDFMLFVNGSVQNYVYAFFYKHLPSIAELVIENKGVEQGMAWFGQRVESEIMIQEVPRQLKNVRGANSIKIKNQSLSLTCGGNPGEILYIPMHDGWLGIEREEQLIADVVRERFYKRIGYWVTITKTAVETGKKAVVIQGAPATVSVTVGTNANILREKKKRQSTR